MCIIWDAVSWVYHMYLMALLLYLVCKLSYVNVSWAILSAISITYVVTAINRIAIITTIDIIVIKYNNINRIAIIRIIF